MRKPRILHLTTVAATQWHFQRGQNHFLQQAGFEVHAAAAPSVQLDKLAARDGVTTHAVPLTRKMSPLRDARSLVRLVRLLRDVRPDILHLSTPKAALLGSIAGTITRVPIRLLFSRGLLSLARTGFHHRLEQLTARLCTHHLFVSPSLLEHARMTNVVAHREGSVPAKGMSNGIDVTRFDPSVVSPAIVDEGPIIGFVGRLVKDKGLLDLFESWQVLRDRHRMAKLLLVGEWETRDAVPRQIRRAFENDPRVICTGPVDDPRPYYRSMTVFAFPSHREGFPNAPMEAAAMGLPVVTTDAVGCRDAVVDRLTGHIVPSGNAQELTEAIETYLRNSALAESIGTAARQRVARSFQPRQIWSHLATCYHTWLEAADLPLPRTNKSATAA